MSINKPSSFTTSESKVETVLPLLSPEELSEKEKKHLGRMNTILQEGKESAKKKLKAFDIDAKLAALPETINEIQDTSEEKENKYPKIAAWGLLRFLFRFGKTPKAAPPAAIPALSKESLQLLQRFVTQGKQLREKLEKIPSLRKSKENRSQREFKIDEIFSETKKLIQELKTHIALRGSPEYTQTVNSVRAILKRINNQSKNNKTNLDTEILLKETQKLLPLK